MRMIHLRFEDAGVFPDQSMLLGKQKKLARKHKNWAYSENEKKYVLQSLGSKNFMNPITTNIVANVLRALSNDIPVPTLKPSSIAKNPIFEELASNAYVRYDAPMADGNGKPALLEYITTNKSHVKDSHQRATQCFELFDGSILEIRGCYNWQYFFQTFDNNNPINKDTIISLIDETLGICKVNEKLTFDEMVKEISRYWANIDFKRKVLDFFKDNYTTNAINESWAHVLFGCHYDAKMCFLNTDMTKGNNTTYKAKTPLLYTRGLGLIRRVYGDIYCPINDGMVNAISNGGGVATILDGGLVHFVEFENCDTEWLRMNGYSKILTLEEALKIDSQTIM